MFPIEKYEHIVLASGPKAELDWTEAIRRAEKAVQEEKQILWELDCALPNGSSLMDQPQFMTLQLAFDHFCAVCYAQFKEHTSGAILFRGTPHFRSLLTWDAKEEERFLEWCHDHPERISLKEEVGPDYPEELFARDLFVDFLGLLLPALPEDLPVFLCFNGTQYPLHVQLQLLTPEKFYPFRLLFQNSEGGYSLLFGQTGEQKIGILLPSGSSYHLQPYRSLERLVIEMEKRQCPYLLLPSDDLNMHWAGVERLLFDPDSITASNRRMLQGFQASGGEVFTFHEWRHLI